MDDKQHLCNEDRDFALIKIGFVLVALALMFSTPITPAVTAEKSDSDQKHESRKFRTGKVFPLDSSFPFNVPLSTSGPVIYLDRFGYGAVYSKTNIWDFVNNLENALPSSAPQHIKKLRTLILERIMNDRVLVFDEVLELANAYRKRGYDEASDNALGLLITLLDRGAPYSPRSRLNYHNVGADRDPYKYIPAFQYSKKQQVCRQRFTKHVADYGSDLKMGEFNSAADSLSKALYCVVDNPLLRRDVKRLHYARKIAALRPHISVNERSNLDGLESVVTERLALLEKLQLPKHSKNARS